MSVSSSKKTGRGKVGATHKLSNPLSAASLVSTAPVKKPRKLTARQEAFVSIYAKKRNATLAAIEAGYSKHTAYSHGSRLLKDVDLQRRIQSYGQLGLDTLAEISHDNTYNELARVNAAKALTERAYGMAKSGDKSPIGNITIQFNRVEVPDSTHSASSMHTPIDVSIHTDSSAETIQGEPNETVPTTPVTDASK